MLVISHKPLASGLWQIKNATGASVNDVIFSCLSGAIQRYLHVQRDIPGPATSMKALIPVGFPPDPKSTRLANTWAFVTVPMPVTEPHPEARLRRTMQDFTAIKTSAYARVALACTNLSIKTLPISVCRDTTTNVFARHSIVFSNVPGPQTPVCLAGAVMTEIQQVFLNCISQAGVLSYNGTLYGNLVVDSNLVPDPRALGHLYIAELQALAAAVLGPTG